MNDDALPAVKHAHRHQHLDHVRLEAVEPVKSGRGAVRRDALGPAVEHRRQHVLMPRTSPTPANRKTDGATRSRLPRLDKARAEPTATDAYTLGVGSSNEPELACSRPSDNCAHRLDVSHVLPLECSDAEGKLRGRTRERYAEGRIRRAL